MDDHAASLAPASLSFDEEEIDAILLGLSQLAIGDEPEWSDAVESALAKVASLLPPPRMPADGVPSRDPRVDMVRRAIGTETKLRLGYVDKKGRGSERVIWPIEINLFDFGDGIAAWCESRQAFRHFRLDRIKSLDETGDRYSVRRKLLLARWRADQILSERY